VNLKRLFTLAEEQHADLRAVFTALGPPVVSGTPA
jgi:hypothetical protein